MSTPPSTMARKRRPKQTTKPTIIRVKTAWSLTGILLPQRDRIGAPPEAVSLPVHRRLGRALLARLHRGAHDDNLIEHVEPERGPQHDGEDGDGPAEHLHPPAGVGWGHRPGVVPVPAHR